jgi:hypothetical protein|tara:strand:- start:3303 stop:3677 length:375 start_codon:yes stop_codon:yes gene_type:complete
MDNEIKKYLQDKFPTASKGFIDVLVDALDIHAKKRNDYTGTDFVQKFSKFETLSKFYDIRRKYDRLYNIMVKDTEIQVDEKLKDTALDLGNYAFLLVEYINEANKNGFETSIVKKILPQCIRRS